MSEIKIKLPKVFEILSPKVKKRYKCLKGGRASGKSWGAVLALFYISTTYKTFICCVREIQKSIKESSQKLIIDTIKRYGLEDEFYITKTEITHKITGSRFIFFGIKSNPESVKSLEGADIVWVEEADRVSQESWDLLIPTVRKEHSQIWATYNPNLPTDPVEIIFDPAKNPEAVRVHLTYKQNKFCSKTTKKEAELMLATDPAKYEWIYLGGYRPQGDMTWIGMSEVMPCFGREVTPDPQKMVVGGLDLGFSRDRSVLIIRKGFFIIKVFVWKNADPEDLSDEIIGIVQKYHISLLGVDALGPGAPVVSKLNKFLPGRIIAVKYSEAAKDEKMYTNLRSEAWGNIKDFLIEGSIPDDLQQEWITDLCQIRYGYDIKGRYALESKKLLVARGFPSTDMADALGISTCFDDNLKKVQALPSYVKSLSSGGFSGF